MVLEWIVTNWSSIIEMLLALIGLASVIVKLTPTLADDHYFKEIIKFIGKFIALNKNITEEEQEFANEIAKYK